MQKVTVLYNDQCPVCSIEIEHYRGLSLRHALHLDFEPLSVPGPVYTALGLTLENAKRRLHVRDRHGEVAIGVDAFLVIWRELPGYRLLAKVVQAPGIYHFANLIYNWILAPMLFQWDRRRMIKAAQSGPQ